MSEEKKMQSLEKQAIATTAAMKKYYKAIELGVEDSSKALDYFEKKYSKINKQLSDSPKYFKNIEKLADKFQEVDKTVQELEKNLAQMGVDSSSQLANITKEADKVGKEFFGLLKVSNQINKSQASFDALPKKLKEIQKGLKGGFSTGDIKNFINSLSDLKGSMDPSKFDSLKESLEKGMDSKNLDSFNASLKEVSGVYLRDIISNFEDLKDQGVFKSLDEGSKQMIDNLLKTGDSVTSLEDLESKMKDIASVTPKVNQAFTEFTTKNESSLVGFAKKLGKTSEGVKALARTFEESSIISLNVKNVTETANDLIDHIKQKTGELHLFPSQTIDHIDAIRSKQEELIKQHESLLHINGLIAEVGDRDDKIKSNLINRQKHITKRIQETSKSMEESVMYAEANLEAANAMSTHNWGLAKTKQLSVNIFKAEHGLRNLSDHVKKSFPGISGMIDKMADKFKLMGNNAGKFKFGAMLLTGAVSLGKAIMKIDEKSSSLFQSVNDSGLMVGKSASEAKSAMKDLAHETNNVMGLTKATSGFGNELALSKTEIDATVSALNQAGLAGKNLKQQMKGVSPEIGSTTSDLAGAASVVRTFSSELGIADSDVAGMMGNMAADFNSTMGSMVTTFTEISSAAQNSSMSSTRFLGILGTSTAGLSIYAEQVSSTSKALEMLSNVSGLTEQGVSAFAKSAVQGAQDAAKFATNLSVFASGGGITKLTSSIGESISDIEVKMKEAEKRGDGELVKQLKGQLENSKEMVRLLEKGEIYEASHLADTIGPEALVKLQATMLKDLIEKSGGMGAKAQQIAEKQGLGEMYRQIKALGSGGAATLNEIESGKASKTKSTQEMRDATKAKDDLTGNATNKLATAVENMALLYAKSYDVILKALTAIGAAAGGGGMAKGVMDIISTAADLKSLAGGTKVGGKAAEYAGKAGGALKSVAGGLFDKVAGSKAAGSVMGALTKGGGGMMSKLLPGMGAIASIKDVWDMGSKAMSGEEITTKDMVELGLSVTSGIAGLLPGIGTAVSVGLAAANVAVSKGALDDFFEDKKETMPAPNVNNPVPQAKTNAPTNPYANSTGTSSGAAGLTASNGSGVNIIINGQDEERIRRVVLDTMQKTRLS